MQIKLCLISLCLLTLAAACADDSDPSHDESFPSGLTEARVISVTDGDTIDVLINGNEDTVRYIGIDAPEVSRGVECYGPEAEDYNRSLVEGEVVALEKDTSDRDEFGRLLRYVWLDGEMVNATLVRQGYAEAKSYPPDDGNDELFERLEEDARDAGRGMWGPGCTPVPTQSPPIAEGQTCEFSGTSKAVIKGNISQDDGDHIYHLPGQADYAATRINEDGGERWFCTESEAVAAGWRKASR